MINNCKSFIYKFFILDILVIKKNHFLVLNMYLLNKIYLMNLLQLILFLKF
jgi:hypothetical protein